MDAAVAPPNALLPVRNGKVYFSSDNPPIFGREQHPAPINPSSGRYVAHRERERERGVR